MSDAKVDAVSETGGGLANALWKRQLPHYPERGPRFFYLGVVVLTTIILYYLYYVEGAVTPLMLPFYHMSFQYFLTLLVISNAIGAFTAFIGGLSDRIGRGNLTIFGTLIVGLIQLGVPSLHTKLGFFLAYCAIGFVEGIILVATPALIRDFSPQMGRAAAMGFWALGPVLGSLTASLVANHTLSAHAVPSDFKSQFVISGVVCMVIVVIAFFGLRELSPGLRDQLMVSEKDRALVEAKALGIDVEAAVAHPLRSMMKLDLFASSVAVAVFLLIYYASVSVLTIYWVVVFNRTASQANGINTWYWVADSITLIVVGVLSDRLRVRKPFMVAGAAMTIVMTIVLIVQAGHPTTGYYSNVLVVALLGVAIGVTYTPWMAAYTEAVEAHNPALTATGLAIWGWVLRIVVAGSFLILPLVITTATTLVDNQTQGAELQAFQAAQPYSPSLTAAPPSSAPIPASVVAQLNATGKPGPITTAALVQAYDKTDSTKPNLVRLTTALQTLTPDQQKLATSALPALQSALGAVLAGQTPAAKDVATLQATSPTDLGLLVPAAEKLVPAQKKSPNEWKTWWWICLGGQVVFLLLVFTMKGRWSPKAAKADLEAREKLVEEELAALGREPAGSSA